MWKSYFLKIITKMKFKCIKGCGDEISFEDVKKHYSSNCLENKRKIKVLTSEEVSRLREKNKGIELEHLNSK